MKHKVQLEISPKDTMYEGNAAHYFAVGESALHCVRTAMMAAKKPRIHKILDFACGYGRVLRVFKSNLPEAELTACDISADAIAFCANTFGAEPILSSEDPREIRFKSQFDLIWCGSLLTQFDEAQFVRFLELLESLLAADGLLIFTTHGPFVARQLRLHSGNYGLNEQSMLTLLSGYDTTGFGYVDYPSEILPRVGVKKYGFCVAKPSWVIRQLEARPGMRLVTYSEQAWDNHQDSVACMNR